MSARREQSPPRRRRRNLPCKGRSLGPPPTWLRSRLRGRTELHAPVTDIYALGGILYKILTGQSPAAPTSSFTGSQGQRKFVFVESPPPSTIDKNVDPILERFCLRAMATDPGARFPRALELAQEIQRWLDEHPLSFKSLSLTDKVSIFLKPFLIPLLVVLVGGIAALATLLIMRWGK